MYYFIELAGSITNIALLSLFMSRLFVRNKIQSKWHYTFLTLLCTGQCVLSLFPNWVIPRTLYLLLGGFLLARLFYEVQTWPAAFASGSFFVLGSVVEILAMLLIGVRLPDTDLLMQVGAARLIYVVFYVSVVNAMLIHDFSDNSIRKLKTDRADSLKIANYALTFWNQLPPYTSKIA